MLKGKNICLRALEPNDIELVYKWENDASVWNITNTITPYSKHILKQYIANAHLDIYTVKQLRLAIDILKDNIKTIGFIELFDFDPHNQRAGIGILLAEEERKKGYASEALKLIVNYAFNILLLHQLFCNISVNNADSIKLFKKHGFNIIGVKKEWTKHKDAWEDEYMLQLICTQ